MAGAWRSYRPNGYGPHRDQRSRPPWRRGLPAPYVLPAGFAALLAIGTVAAALHGRLNATGVLICCAVVVGALAPVAEPTAAAPLGLIGWLTAVGFSRPPYADLRLTGAVAERAAITLAVTAVAATVAGAVVRQWSARVKLETVDRRRESGIDHPQAAGRRRDRRRRPARADGGAVGLPLTSTSPTTC